MDKVKTINIKENIMLIDPAVKSNTKIFINDNLFCEIAGDIDEQIYKIKSLVIIFHVTKIKIDTSGFGIAFYDKLNEIFA